MSADKSSGGEQGAEHGEVTTFPERRVLVYIATSVDGYIATQEDGLGWLDTRHAKDDEGEDFGYAALHERVDTYIVGRRTFDVVRALCAGQFAQASKYRECYVLSRSPQPPHEGVQFFQGHIPDLIADIRSRAGGDIYCDGGAAVIKEFLVHDLVDEFIITVIPIMLGDGIRLFQGGSGAKGVQLVSTRSFKSGVVQLHYERKRSQPIPL